MEVMGEVEIDEVETDVEGPVRVGSEKDLRAKDIFGTVLFRPKEFDIDDAQFMANLNGKLAILKQSIIAHRERVMGHGK